MSKVTASQTVDLLRQAVLIKGPDYIYPSSLKSPHNNLCQYEIDGEPACIVGYVMSFFPNLSWDYWRDGDDERQFNAGGYSQIEGLREQFTPAAVEVLGRAQTIQDDGRTWGTALERAIDFLGGFDDDPNL
jgi:hypothetical protein